MKKLIPLFLLTALLLCSCADMGEPANTPTPDTTTAATTAVTTIDRDKINNPEKLTELEIEAKNRVWAVVKPGITNSDITINNVSVSRVSQFDEAIVCYYQVNTRNQIMMSPMTWTEEVLGYTFEYPYLELQLFVFANNRKYTLQGAYDAGVLTEDEIRMIWEN